MRNWLMGAMASPFLVALSFGATAQATPIEGTVISSESRWAYQHSAIVTESVVEADDGSRITVPQAGGSTGGIGLRQSHSPPTLRVGDRVFADAQLVATRSGRRVHQLRELYSLRRGTSREKNQDTRDFVRTENSSGKQIFWKSGCVLISTAAEGSAQISGEAEFRVVDEVLRTWQGDGSSCSDFELISEGPTEEDVGFDGVNLIKFRENLSCRPATNDDPQECYDEAAAGITTIFFVDDDGSSRNGEILDADIEFNGVQFAIAVDGQTSGTAQCEADFANTLTHELGHLLGLDHTCWAGGERLEDDQGNTVPACTSPTLGSAITEATMYNFQSCGETKKATLEADDVAAYCALYPRGEHTTTCEAADITSGGCCSVSSTAASSPGRGTGLLSLLCLIGLAFGLRRRTRQNES